MTLIVVPLSDRPATNVMQGPHRAVVASTSSEADALYAMREDLPNALAAAAFWAQQLAKNESDFEAAWKLARACYWLGGHVPEAERRARFEQGIEAGRRAAAAQPNRPDGHFWMAANMGGMAEGFGLRAGLRYRGPIKASLEKALAIDAAYLDGSADRALGRWYARVPRLFGGSDAKAVEHLQRSLKYLAHEHSVACLSGRGLFGHEPARRRTARARGSGRGAFSP